MSQSTLNFVIAIGDKKVVLDTARLEKFWDLLHGAEVMEQKWVGTGKGTTGACKDYIPIIGIFEAHKDLTVTPVSQEQIAAIKFVMKQQEQ